MKRLVCALLAAMMLFSMAGMAAAEVSAVYEGDKMTVTTDDQGFFEILIDGVNTYRWVGTGMPGNTFYWELEDGEHSLVLLSLEDGAIGSSASFWKGEAPAETQAPAESELPSQESTAQPALEPTAAPAQNVEAQTPVPTAEPTAEPTQEPTAAPTDAPKGPVKIESVLYQDGQVQFEVSGLRGYAEVWLDGKNTGRSVNTNGANAVEAALATGAHTLMLYAPAVNEVDEKTFDAVFVPDMTQVSPEALGSLVKAADGKALAYTVSYSTSEAETVLIFAAEEAENTNEELGLYLSDSLIRLFLDLGFTSAGLENGNTQLIFDLKQISPSWFDTDKAIWYYVFSTCPLSAYGAQVNVSAQTSSTETIDAVSYTGVKLVRGGNSTFVASNGVY